MSLNEEFEEMSAETRKTLKNKIKIIAELLREANELCEQNGTNLIDCYSEVQPLFSVMDDLGWSSSSLSC